MWLHTHANVYHKIVQENIKFFNGLFEIGGNVLSQCRLMIQSRILTNHVSKQNLTVKKKGFYGYVSQFHRITQNNRTRADIVTTLD
jgi:hypothetical protein